jgi:ComF family protein
MGRALLEGCLDLTSERRCASCEASLGRGRLLCPRCADTVIRVDGGVAGTATQAYAYHGGALAEAIRRFKYGRRPDLGGPLGELLIQTLPAAFAGSRRWALVVPVPLHPRRLAARGYNQAALLARPLAHWLGARHAPELLVRTLDTPPQARLSGAARRRNLAGAFAASRPQRIGSRPILLIDDVTTTGTTLEACRAALLAAGATRVDALAVTCSERGHEDAPTSALTSW